MNETNRVVFVSAAILGFLALAIGAFGSHALTPLLIANDRVVTFETANQYHFYHALAMLFLSLLPVSKKTQKLHSFIYTSMLSGVIVFSGSLYLLSISDIRWLGAITPIGGLFLLFSWGLLIRYAYISSDN